MTSRICHVHGDTFAACQGLPHPSRVLYCDGQGSLPQGGRFTSRKYGVCPRCEKTIALRANGTIRAHSGRGK